MIVHKWLLWGSSVCVKKFILPFFGWIFQQNKISTVSAAKGGDLLGEINIKAYGGESGGKQGFN